GGSNMAKRSHVKRQMKYSGEHEVQGFRENRRGKDIRTRNGKHKQTEESSNIVDLNSRCNQVVTAYAPNRIKTPLQARTAAQQRYINAIKTHSLTFGIGPAGTGKSYCAGALAAEALESGRIERIILTRPAVEAGEQLGFLP